jgi:RNA polymerase sigma factor (sigma-70 family)
MALPPGQSAWGSSLSDNRSASGRLTGLASRGEEIESKPLPRDTTIFGTGHRLEVADMPSGQLGTLVEYLRRVAAPQDAAAAPDGLLVERFATRRDEAAFAALVQRHGPLVWGVCRRVLGRDPDAEDAFQATFLVLARKAGAIGKRASVRSWLYSVAYRVAVRARATAARRQAREKPVAELPAAAVPPHDPGGQELRAILDEEVSRLPERQRLPVILCYLEGKTNDEAAQELGCPRGTVATHLARARQRLRGRLARRGVALGAVIVAAVPAALTDSTARAATRFAGRKPADPGSTNAAALAEGVLKAMLLSKLKITTAAVLALGLLVAGAAVPIGYQVAAGPQPGGKKEAAGKPPAPQTAEPSQTPVWSQRATLKKHTEPVLAVAFAPDGKSLLAGGGDKVLSLWDVASGRIKATFEGNEGSVISVAFAPDGKRWAAAAHEDKVVRVWRDEERKIEGQDEPGHVYLLERKLEHDAPVYAVAFSPDGKKLVAAGGQPAKPAQPGFVTFWDPDSGNEQGTLQGHTDVVAHVAFAPDGKTLATTGGDRTVLVWDLTKKSAPRSLGELDDKLMSYALAFSSDGKTVAAGVGKKIKLYDTATARERATLEGHQDTVFCLAFSPDGKTLASGSSRKVERTFVGQVKLWDPATGKERATIDGDMGIIRALAFARDGMTMATAGSAKDTIGDDGIIRGEAGVVKLWELKK